MAKVYFLALTMHTDIQFRRHIVSSLESAASLHPFLTPQKPVKSIINKNNE